MHPKYELTFWGGACTYFRNIVGYYQRIHDTYESAEREAARVGEILDQDGTRAAHRASIDAMF